MRQMLEWLLFDDDHGLSKRIWKRSLAAGLIMIGLSVLILLVPELLVAMVASVFMLIGTLLLVSAWHLRKASARPRRADRFEEYWTGPMEWN